MAVGCSLLHPRREGRAEVQGLHPTAVFAKRLCDVFDDEVNRIAQEVSVARPGAVSLDRVTQQYA